MGVKGLWKLIESCGVPVPLETLEHKILGVDVSIWLHQAVRGFRGPGGAAVANAHLLTLFHRICKLLFYRIRPVFIFDGGVPHLKKQTLAARRLKRDVAANKAKQVRDRLLSNLLKSQAVRRALGKTGRGPSEVHVPKPQKKEKDMFELPPLPPLEIKEEEMTTVKSEENEYEQILSSLPNLHHFDYEGKEFKALPIEIQQVVLSELQTTRKENSWATINEMPQDGGSFAEFQMDRLMKRRKFQVTLDTTQEEIQKKRAVEMEAEMFGDLEKHVSLTHRIISEDSAHSILVKKVKEDDLKKEEEVKIKKEEKGKSLMKSKNGNFEKDFLTELAKQGIVNKARQSDSESDCEESYYVDGDDEYRFNSQAKTEMEDDGLLHIVGSLMENSGLTQDEILALIKQESTVPGASKREEVVADEDKPSTSRNASGFVFNPDADSSDDDSDLIEIEEKNDSLDLPGSKTNGMAKEAEQGSNVDKILENKNDSLWMKIVQQKLDDMVHTETDKNSPKKAVVDTRRSEENQCKSSSEEGNGKLKAVAISLDFDVKPLKMEDDIFADIFTDINATPVSKPVLDSVQPNGHIANIKETTSVRDVLENEQQGKHKLDTPTIMEKATTDKTENTGKAVAPSTVNRKDVEISTELQSKIQDLVKLEIEKVMNSHGSKTAPKEDTKYSSLAEEEMAVDDVEIMSSSDDSDLEEVESSLKKAEEEPVLPRASVIQEVTDKANRESDDDDDLIEVNDDNDISESLDKHKSIEQRTSLAMITSPEREDNVSRDLQENKKSTDSAESPQEMGNNSPRVEDDSKNCIENQCTSSVNPSITQSEKEQTEIKISSNSDIDLKEMHALDKENVEEVERPLEYSNDELKHLEEELASEQQSLVAQAQKIERIASNLNDQMYGEAQELLQLFGIPYLVAPMEAEAQCAFLNAQKLTTGTITDDSDIFLFGGCNVYKNFFNQTKHVEVFKTENIKANIGLDRDKMISLALLTGSDYTVGIESVGAVLAMEVLAEFPGEGLDCLNNMKKWWNVAHRNVSAAYQTKVKQRLSQITIPESFPNKAIFDSYYQPEVDESLEKFSWAVPNVDSLRMFTMEKFGWNRAKADEILVPVMKKLGIKTSQTRIDSFYTNIKLVKESKFTSKRMQDAIARAKGEEPPSSNAATENRKRNSSASRGRPKTKRRKMEEAEEPLEEEDETEDKTPEGSPHQGDNPAPKKPSRTLLIDPSESSSSPAKPKRGRPKKMTEENCDEASGPSLASANTSTPKEIKPKRKVTKEDMYKALLEKETIAQREADKKLMEEKKRIAAQLLKEKIKKKKR
ncbi:LOW QUALITY PROTEIN: DNA excision repair protein ERCC-5 homolog [Penaeus japonicus]|uniref:LOW QUALITY PROTEIN: DNA excision repair protein ERCC-5 homolog n=1 Tax=Penaeus japonicus TaxID=27405 RepID=UPI001C710CEA|nr:LOW QUALITY PROTEIN: DNA excision repair protein ERCC-5 homolog [Penaeus japonicus]